MLFHFINNILNQVNTWVTNFNMVIETRCEQFFIKLKWRK